MRAFRKTVLSQKNIYTYQMQQKMHLSIHCFLRPPNQLRRADLSNCFPHSPCCSSNTFNLQLHVFSYGQMLSLICRTGRLNKACQSGRRLFFQSDWQQRERFRFPGISAAGVSDAQPSVPWSRLTISGGRSAACQSSRFYCWLWR